MPGIAQTLADMLDNNAWKYPDETAFVWGDQRISHAAFHDRASRLASALFRLGVRRQDRVGILSQNSLAYQEVYGACERSGFICATVNWRLAVPEMVYIINDGAPKVLLFEAAYRDTILAMRSQLSSVAHFICIDGAEADDFALDYQGLVAAGDPAGVPFRPRPDDVAFLIYTSGTTGRPKGVMLSHAGQVAAAEILGADQRNCSADRRSPIAICPVGMIPFQKKCRYRWKSASNTLAMWHAKSRKRQSSGIWNKGRFLLASIIRQSPA